MSDFFNSKTKDTTPQLQAVADPYGTVRNPLVNYLGNAVNPSTAGSNSGFPQYQGQMVAPLSDAQNNSQKTLNDYANSSLTGNSTFQAGKGAINQMLNTTTDPSTSPYYQAIKAEAGRNMALTDQSIANANAGAGRFYSGANAYDTGMANQASTNNLNQTMGQLALNEQQLKANVLPVAQQYAQTEQNFPLAQTAALQTYGALPNIYQQAVDTANYGEWNAANYTRPDTAAQIAALVQEAPVYAQKSSVQEPSPFQQWAPTILGPGAGNYAAGINGATNGYGGQVPDPSSIITSAMNVLNTGGGTTPGGNSTAVSGQSALSGAPGTQINPAQLAQLALMFAGG